MCMLLQISAVHVFFSNSLFRKFEETKVHFFKISTPKFQENFHNFAALCLKYRIEQRKISRHIVGNL